ncbi:hypothetical protein ScPMuIL_004505 [Solemya velum]
MTPNPGHHLRGRSHVTSPQSEAVRGSGHTTRQPASGAVPLFVTSRGTARRYTLRTPSSSPLAGQAEDQKRQQPPAAEATSSGCARYEAARRPPPGWMNILLITIRLPRGRRGDVCLPWRLLPHQTTRCQARGVDGTPLQCYHQPPGSEAGHQREPPPPPPARSDSAWIPVTPIRRDRSPKQSSHWYHQHRRDREPPLPRDVAAGLFHGNPVTPIRRKPYLIPIPPDRSHWDTGLLTPQLQTASLTLHLTPPPLQPLLPAPSKTSQYSRPT